LTHPNSHLSPYLLTASSAPTFQQSTSDFKKLN